VADSDLKWRKMADPPPRPTDQAATARVSVLGAIIKAKALIDEMRRQIDAVIDLLPRA